MAKTGYERLYGFDRVRKNNALSSDLRHQVLLQLPATSSDGEGGFFDGWVTKTTTWASISPITAKQRDSYKSLSAEITHMIKIRGEVDCDTTYQVKFDDRVFEILTVENIQERDMLKILMCKERSR